MPYLSECYCEIAFLNVSAVKSKDKLVVCMLALRIGTSAETLFHSRTHASAYSCILTQ